MSNNIFRGQWNSASFVGTHNSLLTLDLSYNQITSLPPDVWGKSTLNKVYVTFDMSYNRLNGSLPAGQPKATVQYLKFEGNPNFKDTNLNLPVWAVPSSTFIKSSATDNYACPVIKGNGLQVTVSMDPSYYGYKGCKCDRGFYGNPPNCQNIPAYLTDNTDVPSVQDTQAFPGTARLMQGVDISYIFAPSKIDARAIQFDVVLKPDFFCIDSQYPDVPNKLIITGGCPSGFNYNPVTRRCSCQQSELYDFASGSCQATASYPEIKDTFNIVSPSDLTSTVTLMNDGTYTTCAGATQSKKFVVINNYATVLFQSKKFRGNHFALNVTYQTTCPTGYEYYESFDGTFYLSSRCEKRFEVSTGIQSAAYAIIGLMSMLIIGVTYLVVKKRTSLIIRSASFPFCFMMLLCMILLSAGSIFYVITPQQTKAICHLRPWFTALPLMGILSALLVKADRIRKIFNTKELVVQAISNSQLAKTAGVMIVGELILLLTFSIKKLAVGKPVLGSGVTSGYLVYICELQTNYNIWMAIQFAYIALFLFAGVVEAWGVRKVPSAFNEGPHIASCLLSLAVLLVILIPLNFMVDDNPDALMIIRGLGQVLVTTVMCFFLFGPKIYYILEGKENDKSLSSIGSSKSSTSSSSSFSTSSSAAESKPSVDLNLFVNLYKSISNVLTNQTTDFAELNESAQKIKSAGISQISEINNQIDIIKTYAMKNFDAKQ